MARFASWPSVWEAVRTWIRCFRAIAVGASTFSFVVTVNHVASLVAHGASAFAFALTATHLTHAMEATAVFSRIHISPIPTPIAASLPTSTLAATILASTIPATSQPLSMSRGGIHVPSPTGRLSRCISALHG